MIGPARKWEERRRLLEERKPKIRIDQVLIHDNEKGSVEVTITGYGLHPGATPPLVTIGGTALQRIKVEDGGRRLIGFLYERPKNDKVIVDLGHARAEMSIQKSQKHTTDEA